MADQYMDDASIALVRAANLPISLDAIEEIIREEDDSEFFYKQHYQRPEWPGGSSGVTILLGYDLGYATPEKVRKDLAGVDPGMVEACVSCCGVTGSAAHQRMLEVRSRIDLPWEVALRVFLANDMPEWIATCEKYLPNFDKLSPDGKGVMVSLAYNRGPSFNNAGDRYREMRAIKADMASKNFADIPAQLRSMARLWPAGNGVHGRRLREAALFEKGLRGPPVRGSVEWTQHSLNLLGGDHIGEDGKLGPATETKIKAFQVARGLPDTGAIDENLCCTLDLALTEKTQATA